MGSCASCGAPIPKGQTICSMCYGDPFYGRDGYYLAYLQDLYERSAEEEADAELWGDFEDDLDYEPDEEED